MVVEVGNRQKGIEGIVQTCVDFLIKMNAIDNGVLNMIFSNIAILLMENRKNRAAVSRLSSYGVI